MCGAGLEGFLSAFAIFCYMETNIQQSFPSDLVQGVYTPEANSFPCGKDDGNSCIPVASLACLHLLYLMGALKCSASEMGLMKPHDK